MPRKNENLKLLGEMNLESPHETYDAISVQLMRRIQILKKERDEKNQ